ncbi:MAG: hypothetical protein WBP58_11270 [Chitinophagaceae bacterium]
MKKLSLFVFLALGLGAFAQESEHAKPGAEHEHSMKGASRLTLGLGHTHISEGVIDGKTRWLVAGSWSLNYDYWISNKFAIGIQNDLVMETFIIEDKEKESIERSYPWSIVPVAIYKPGKRFSMLGGVGYEVAAGKSLALTRLGIEYGFHLPKNWEVGAALVWDNKWNYYNSWGLAFTFSKIWPNKN